MARFVHIADLHLGKTLHQSRLLDDQRAALESILTFIENATPEIDAVLVAGDVYDRSVPPAEAVELLSWFMDEVVNRLDTQIIVIPGNHDSAERLGFGATLTKATVHIAKQSMEMLEPIPIHDEHGLVEIFAWPFLDPSQTRDLLGTDDILNFETATQCLLEALPAPTPGSRQVLIAHAFVGDNERRPWVSDSERDLTVGGSELVSVGCFERFNYVALGHLHRAQSIGSDRVQYAGSLLKYSKSEADHEKTFTVIELTASGAIITERVPLRINRDLRIIRGHFAEIMTTLDTQRDDFIFVELLDTDPISEVMNRLREKYPNTLHLEYVRHAVDGKVLPAPTRHQAIGMDTHFSRFFEQVRGEPLSDEQRTFLRKVIGEVESDLEASP